MFSLSVLLFSFVLLVPSFLVLPRFCHSDRLFLLCSFTLLFLFCTIPCHSVRPPCHSEEPSPRHSEHLRALPSVILRSVATKNLIQGHSERSKESISTLNFCEQLAVLFSFSRTFLCKKVPKSFCTVKMAASVFGRSLSGHGRLTLFRTPAPGARSLDERNPAISTSAEQRFKCPSPQKTTVIPTTCLSFRGAVPFVILRSRRRRRICSPAK